MSATMTAAELQIPESLSCEGVSREDLVWGINWIYRTARESMVRAHDQMRAQGSRNGITMGDFDEYRKVLTMLLIGLTDEHEKELEALQEVHKAALRIPQKWGAA